MMNTLCRGSSFLLLISCSQQGHQCVGHFQNLSNKSVSFSFKLASAGDYVLEKSQINILQKCVESFNLLRHHYYHLQVFLLFGDHLIPADVVQSLQQIVDATVDSRTHPAVDRQLRKHRHRNNQGENRLERVRDEGEDAHAQDRRKKTYFHQKADRKFHRKLERVGQENQKQSETENHSDRNNGGINCSHFELRFAKVQSQRYKA